jgi:hypothetical protein
MIYGPKNDGTYVVEFRRVVGDFRSWRSPRPVGGTVRPQAPAADRSRERTIVVCSVASASYCSFVSSEANRLVLGADLCREASQLHRISSTAFNFALMTKMWNITACLPPLFYGEKYRKGGAGQTRADRRYD